jgi:hypothetical protein
MIVTPMLETVCIGTTAPAATNDHQPTVRQADDRVVVVDAVAALGCVARFAWVKRLEVRHRHAP